MILGGYFSDILIFSTLMVGMITNYIEFTLNRDWLQDSQTAVTLMIFDKIAKINVLKQN
jgi:hypothetical protein